MQGNKIEVEIIDNKRLKIKYKPLTSHVIYDISDNNGKIIKTGPLLGNEAEIGRDGLQNGWYYIHVIDGENLIVESFYHKL